MDGDSVIPGDAVVYTRQLKKIYGYGANAVHALKGVDMYIRRGEFVSIMGQSGSGKSTLLHVLGCLHKQTSGLYMLDGINVGELSDNERSYLRNTRIGFVFQKYNLLNQEDIVSNVALPLAYARMPRKKRRRRAAELLETVGLGDRLHHSPMELSGGQDQRVAIARALVTDPAILLADEPTGNLDSENGRSIMALFQNLHAGGRTIIQVTHDAEKTRYGERVIRLKDGRIISDEKVTDRIMIDNASDA